VDTTPQNIERQTLGYEAPPAPYPPPMRAYQNILLRLRTTGI